MKHCAYTEGKLRALSFLSRVRAAAQLGLPHQYPDDEARRVLLAAIYLGLVRRSSIEELERPGSSVWIVHLGEQDEAYRFALTHVGESELEVFERLVLAGEVDPAEIR